MANGHGRVTAQVSLSLDLDLFGDDPWISLRVNPGWQFMGDLDNSPGSGFLVRVSHGKSWVF